MEKKQKSLFDILNEQFQAGAGFVTLRGEVKEHSPTRLVMDVESCGLYAVTSDSIVPISAPVAVSGEVVDGDARTFPDGTNVPETHPDRPGFDPVTASPVVDDGSVPAADVTAPAETLPEQPDASDAGSEGAGQELNVVVATEGERTEPFDVGGETSESGIIEGSVAEVVEGLVSQEKLAAVPSEDQDKLNEDVKQILAFFGAADLDATADREGDDIVFLLKDMAGEEITRGTLSKLLERATAGV